MHLCAGRLIRHPLTVAAKLDRAPDRLEALLAIAFRRRLAPHLLQHIVEAAQDSFRGDQGLANMRLALAGLSRLPAAEDLPQRLAMADVLLADGMTPSDLLRALELEGVGDGLVKYDPGQPRVPAGSGQESGRWTSGEGGSAPAPAAVGTAAAPAGREMTGEFEIQDGGEAASPPRAGDGEDSDRGISGNDGGSTPPAASAVSAAGAAVAGSFAIEGRR